MVYYRFSIKYPIPRLVHQEGTVPRMQSEFLGDSLPPGGICLMEYSTCAPVDGNEGSSGVAGHTRFAAVVGAPAFMRGEERLSAP